MLVRSQDNKRITENIDFTIVEANNQYEIRHTEHTSGWGLYGKYSTFKKAIKALNEMEKHYNEPIYYSVVSKDETVKLGHTVFQFPAEDEIKDEE